MAASALLSSGEVDATLGVSFGARSSVDAFGFRIRGGLGDIVVDTDLSRDEITILADDGSVFRKAKPEKCPSNYERFVQLARGGIDALAEDPLDFCWGLEVVRIIDSLAEIGSSGIAGRVGGDVDAVPDDPAGGIAATAAYPPSAAPTMISRGRR